MHYCCYIFSREFPSDQVINEKLAPYWEEDFYRENTSEDGLHMKEGTVYPAFTWDWWQIGGRYGGRFKLDAREESDIEEKYSWRFYPKEPRAGRLFRCNLLENVLNVRNSVFEETDVLRYLGIRDNFLYVDGGLIEELINLDYDKKTGCYCYVGLDGNGYARDLYNGDEIEDNKDFESRLISEWHKCEMEGGCYVACIDLHG